MRSSADEVFLVCVPMLQKGACSVFFLQKDSYRSQDWFLAAKIEQFLEMGFGCCF